MDLVELPLGWAQPIGIPVFGLGQVDLTTVTSWTLIALRPDLTSPAPWTGTTVSGVTAGSGTIQYATQPGDINQRGVWYLEIVANLPGGPWPFTPLKFRVTDVWGRR